LDLQAALAGHAHACPVIFLSGAGNIATTCAQGANDFLTNDAPKEHLLDAVERTLV
jgi:FixJ family two-component response regulator